MTRKKYHHDVYTEQQKRQIADEYDELHPDGKFVTPSNPPRLRIRDLHEYCMQKGVEPKDLSKEEMEQFRLKED